MVVDGSEARNAGEIKLFVRWGPLARQGVSVFARLENANTAGRDVPDHVVMLLKPPACRFGRRDSSLDVVGHIRDSLVKRSIS